MNTKTKIVLLSLVVIGTISYLKFSNRTKKSIHNKLDTSVIINELETEVEEVFPEALKPGLDKLDISSEDLLEIESLLASGETLGSMLKHKFRTLGSGLQNSPTMEAAKLELNQVIQPKIQTDVHENLDNGTEQKIEMDKIEEERKASLEAKRASEAQDIANKRSIEDAAIDEINVQSREEAAIKLKLETELRAEREKEDNRVENEIAKKAIDDAEKKAALEKERVEKIEIENEKKEISRLKKEAEDIKIRKVENEASLKKAEEQRASGTSEPDEKKIAALEKEKMLIRIAEDKASLESKLAHDAQEKRKAEREMNKQKAVEGEKEVSETKRKIEEKKEDILKNLNPTVLDKITEITGSDVITLTENGLSSLGRNTLKILHDYLKEQDPSVLGKLNSFSKNVTRVYITAEKKYIEKKIQMNLDHITSTKLNGLALENLVVMEHFYLLAGKPTLLKLISETIKKIENGESPVISVPKKVVRTPIKRSSKKGRVHVKKDVHPGGGSSFNLKVPSDIEQGETDDISITVSKESEETLEKYNIVMVQIKKEGTVKNLTPSQRKIISNAGKVFKTMRSSYVNERTKKISSRQRKLSQ